MEVISVFPNLKEQDYTVNNLSKEDHMIFFLYFHPLYS